MADVGTEPAEPDPVNPGQVEPPTVVAPPAPELTPPPTHQIPPPVSPPRRPPRQLLVEAERLLGLVDVSAQSAQWRAAASRWSSEFADWHRRDSA